MDKNMYIRIEKYMLAYMNDSAHDSQHIYRVLYHALNIASDYIVDKSVLISACLLHDIGREAQFNNPELDHAYVGSNMAYEFLKQIGWEESKSRHVKDCIASHRYRNNNLPDSIEVKILFNADKLDATGVIGIARTLAYKGIVAEPLYSLDEDGSVIDGLNEEQTSFFQEYNWKSKNVYDKFYTDQVKMIADGRRKAAMDFMRIYIMNLTQLIKLDYSY